MRALQLAQPAPAATAPLGWAEQPDPIPPANSVLIRVQACGVCHTDLHIVEGDLPMHKRPITPGHQVIGRVAAIGAGVEQVRVGERIGVPWLHTTCGQCEFCQRGEENLCDGATFTGWDVDGGYADLMVARETALVQIPDRFSDAAAAPLLCAGIIGYRSLIKADVKPGEHVGLIGFGGSAHIAIQIARHWGCPVSVFTRSPQHQRLAADLGAVWAGSLDESPNRKLDRIILFAPVGALVLLALNQLRKGGTLAINAIHLSPIPKFGYNLLYGERTLRSVTSATAQDAKELMRLAAEIPIQTEVELFPLADANPVLLKLKRGEINGAAVLVNED